MILYSSPAETVYSTFEKASAKVFPNTIITTHNIQLSANQVNQIEDVLEMSLPTQNITYFEYSSENDTVGYAMVTNQIGKHYPITFFVAMDRDYAVKDVILLVYREAYGSQVRKRRFMKQFKGKRLSDPIRVNHDITSVSSATLSSYAIANGTRRVLAIINEVL